VLTRDEREAILWDVATSRVRATVHVANGKLEFAEVSPDGSRVLTVESRDPFHVRVYAAGEGVLTVPQLRRRHEGENPAGLSAQFDPTGTRIVSALQSARTYKMHYADGSKRALGWTIDSNDRTSIDYIPKFDPRGGQFVIPNRENLEIWDCEGGERMIRSGFHKASMPLEVFFSTDGSRISAVVEQGGEPTCQVFDADTGKFQRSFAAGVTDCRLIGPGGRLAMCDSYEADRPAELWDVETGAVLQRVGDEWLREASPDGVTLLFATPTKRTSLWRLRQ
jgi:WD40 repeat protein